MYESSDKMVSHPSHYQTKNGLEVIDIIDALTEDLIGIEAVDTANAIKYIARWKKKNGVQDIEKAIWYLTHLKEHLISKDNKEINYCQEIPDDIYYATIYNTEKISQKRDLSTNEETDTNENR